MIELSEDQKTTILKLEEWFEDPKRKPFITIGGYAGTGKTTIISIFRSKLQDNPKSKKLKVAFVSFTGKAANVLKNTIKENNAKYKGDYVGTIHSLIYEPIVDERTQEIIGWNKKEKLDTNLIIVDEASMVDQAIWNDLLSYNVPIIAVGDHGQLPPINGHFNLMNNPLVKLEKIHRQAQDNPIIQIATIARTTGQIPIQRFGKHVEKLDKQSYDTQERVQDLLESYNDQTLIICGFNWTRVKLNQTIRSLLGFEEKEPSIGDRVICLRNNHKAQIFNGMIGNIRAIESADEECFLAEIEFDDGQNYKGLILKKQFNQLTAINFTKERKLSLKADLFDFGYALTAHKAQGSQAKRIILFEERFSKMDDDMWKRWLYTSVTRAEEELFVIGT